MYFAKRDIVKRFVIFFGNHGNCNKTGIIDVFNFKVTKTSAQVFFYGFKLFLVGMRGIESIINLCGNNHIKYYVLKFLFSQVPVRATYKNKFQTGAIGICQNMININFFNKIFFTDFFNCFIGKVENFG